MIDARSRFPPPNNDCAMTLQREARQDADRDRWHQQDHETEDSVLP